MYFLKESKKIPGKYTPWWTKWVIFIFFLNLPTVNMYYFSGGKKKKKNIRETKTT